MTRAKIRCPECKNIEEIDIPQGRCLAFYKCGKCRKLIPAPEDSCCVICAYADKKCPASKQKTKFEILRRFYQ